MRDSHRVNGALKIFLALVAAASASGCDTLKSAMDGGNVHQPQQAFADPKGRPPEPAISFKYYDPGQRPSADANGQTTFPSTQNTLYSRAFDAYFAPEDQRKNAVFVKAAISASNLGCKIWFDELVKLSSSLDRDSANFNIVGNTITALMGLYDAAPRAIGALSTGIAAGNAEFGAQRSLNLLIDIENTQKKIDELRNKLANDPSGYMNRTYATFDEARNAVLEYDKTCSRQEVKRLLAKGVDATNAKVVGTDGPDALEQKAIDAVRNSIASELKTLKVLGADKSLTDQGLLTVYLAVTDGTSYDAFVASMGNAIDLPLDTKQLSDMKGSATLKSLINKPLLTATLKLELVANLMKAKKTYDASVQTRREAFSALKSSIGATATPTFAVSAFPTAFQWKPITSTPSAATTTSTTATSTSTPVPVALSAALAVALSASSAPDPELSTQQYGELQSALNKVTTPLEVKTLLDAYVTAYTEAAKAAQTLSDAVAPLTTSKYQVKSTGVVSYEWTTNSDNTKK